MSKPLTFVPLLEEHEGAIARSESRYVHAAMLLLIYCNRKRNGGRISREVVQDRFELAPLALADLMDTLEGDSALWHWEEDTLVLDVYSAEHERLADERREVRKAAAEARWKTGKKDTPKKGRKCKCNANAMQKQSKRNASAMQTRQIESLSKDREILSLNHARPDCESDSSVSAIETEPPCPPGGVSVEVLSAEEVHAGFEAIMKELE